jgi:hypothetical protein
MGRKTTLDVQALRAGKLRPYELQGAFDDETHRARETFMGEKLPPQVYDTGASWSGVRLQHVGTCEAVAYNSDKWGGRQKRLFEAFKHVVEAPQDLYAVRGSIGGPTCGPIWVPSKEGVIMPDRIAEMAPLEFIQSRLFVSTDEDNEGVLGEGDEGCVELEPAGCLLYVGYLRTSKSDTSGEPILIVLSAKKGVQFVIRGEELDVTKDGIVG